MNAMDPEDPNRARPLEVDDLRARLAEAEETLRAIRDGEVDALLIGDASGDHVYTLRSADAPYRALVEQMHEGALTLNQSGDVMYCNRSFAEMVGAPLQHVIGAPIRQFVDPADYEDLKTLITGGSGTLRTRLARRTATTTDALVSLSTVVVDEVRYPTLIVTDLSTLTKVQRESRSKDEFLAMLAHELRNPLGAIGGAVQVLGLADLRDRRALRACSIIHRQVGQMARLLDDLLDVGRVVTGKIVLDRRPMDLAESVRSGLEAMSTHADVERRVAVTTESVGVDADAVRLEQIVGNLVSNALKFSNGLVRVSVRADAGDAVLSVSDDGEGIDPVLRPHIFDLFVQGVGTAVGRKQHGLGIGLTLVRRLVELHGGSVEVSSEGKGAGATFTVRLPSVPLATVTHTAASSLSNAPTAKRILLVDDNADAREMYGVALQADGHTIYEAADGEAALAIFLNEKPDAAVVDIGLPGMNGYELARRIRSAPVGEAVTLIALTGYGLPEDRERSRAAGFDRHLVKPVMPEDLRAALEDTVRSPRNA